MSIPPQPSAAPSEPAAPGHPPPPPPDSSPPVQPERVETKTELRRHFRQRRRQALADGSGAIAAAAVAVVPTLMAPPPRLGLYWPLGHEPDLRPLVDRLPAPWRHHLALPAIRGTQLLYLPWNPAEPLVPDGAGIPAPAGDNGLEPAELGLLLVPALAVDGSGLRLGSGGGWYDRLRADPRWRAVPALAVLPSICVVPKLPGDPWDVPFTGWLDERGFHKASGCVATS